MNADEARQKALEVNTADVNSQYAKIQTLIAEKASKGEYCVTVDYGLRTDVSNKLKTEGFKVDYTSDYRDGTSTTISWRNEK